MATGMLCSRIVATAAPGESVRTAAQRMAEHGVGTLVVLDGERGNGLAGVVTDRDITLRCTAAGLDPETTPVIEVMSKPVYAVDEGTPVEEAIGRMARTATRRLVVTGEEGRLVGIFTLDDALEFLAQQAGAVGQLLARQQPQIPA